MPITSNPTLRVAVRAWARVGSAILTDDILDEFVAGIEGVINFGDNVPGQEVGPLRNERMMLELAGGPPTWTATGETEALPADFLGVREFFFPDTSPQKFLIYEPPEVFRRLKAVNNTQSSPAGKTFYTIIGTNFHVAPAPTIGQTFVLRYYRMLPSLLVGSNFVVQDQPNVYLFGALAEAAPFLKDDERSSYFIARRNAAIQALRSAGEALKYPSGSLMVEAT